MANFVEPSIAADGSVSFDIRSNNGGHWRGSDQDYIQDELTGEVNHVFQNVELRDEASPEGYSADAYADALHELHPNLSPALEWAETELPAGFIEAYNEAMDGDDLTEKGRYIDMLLQYFSEALGDEQEEALEETYEEQEDPSDEDEVDVTEEQVEAFLDELVQQEALGEEVASEWQAAVDQAQAVGDSAYAAVAAATAAYHAGSVTAEEAIDWALQNVPHADLLRVVRHLTS
jgi:hypothetical protein